MLRSIEELIGLLRELCGGCAELLEAVGREHQALRRGRLAELASAAAEKESILKRIADVERRRAALFGRLAAQAEVPGAALTLETLADRLPADEASRVRQAGAALRAWVERLREAQVRSEALCRGAIDMLQGAHQLLKGFLAGAPVYHGGGTYPPARISGALIRGEV
ncbi:MAG: flagellar protein FlgN [Desulfobacterales bacterium]|nr:flagellar protein FlgN [Desulfobacterales bacterium]